MINDYFIDLILEMWKGMAINIKFVYILHRKVRRLTVGCFNSTFQNNQRCLGLKTDNTNLLYFKRWCGVVPFFEFYT